MHKYDINHIAKKSVIIFYDAPKNNNLKYYYKLYKIQNPATFKLRGFLIINYCLYKI